MQPDDYSALTSQAIPRYGGWFRAFFAESYPRPRNRALTRSRFLAVATRIADYGAAIRLRWLLAALGLAVVTSLAVSDHYRSSLLLLSIAGLLSVAVAAVSLERLLLGLVTVEASRTEARRLHEFARDSTQLDLHREPGPQLASLIQTTFNLEAVGIFDADLHKAYRAGDALIDLENMLWNIYLFEGVSDDPATGVARRVLRIGGLPIGALLLRGGMTPLISSAIACIVAITFDRYHSHANLNRTESARQIEQLRTTVLDSLAHAYKTPLTAIQAASTGLAEMGCLTPAQSELVSLIDEQSSVLNELSTRLLKTARLEADGLALRPETVAIAPLIDDVVASFREQLATLSVRVAVLRENLSVHCDRGLLVSLLSQFVDNAGKYSVAGSTVTIRAAERPGQVVFSVHNMGPVIPPADHDRVFDRYFRSAVSSNQVSGTGIGLSVARRAAQAHGGDVWLTSDHDKGTTFFASLMVMPEEGYRA